MLSKVVPQRGYKPIQSLINVQTRPAFPFPSPRSRSSLSPSASNVGSTLNSVVMMEMCAARPASGLLSVIPAARIVRLTKHTMAYRALPHPRRFRRPGPRRWASTCPGLPRAGSHAHTHLVLGRGKRGRAQGVRVQCKLSLRKYQAPSVCFVFGGTGKTTNTRLSQDCRAAAYK